MKGKVNPAFKQFRISHIEIQPSAKIADFECRGRYQRKAIETPKESRTWVCPRLFCSLSSPTDISSSSLFD